MDFIIDSKAHGMTVLAFLRYEAGLSGAMLRHLKRVDDGITVNGAHVTVRYTLSFGEVLTIKSEDSEPSENIVATDIAIDIVYEDEDIVVPDKPPFVPTHPSHGHFDDTVANALCYRYGGEKSPFVFRAINRLDRNTSGLLLVARNRMAAAKLSASLKSGDVSKEYVAILKGTLPEKEGIIDTYIKRTEASIITRSVCGEYDGGDRALTSYKVLFSNGEYSIVTATPITGRTHQLRVHFSYLGAPIVGDDLYGEYCRHIGRHALHASRLTFPHPKDKREMSFFSPIPNDMCTLIREVFSEDDLREIEELIKTKER